MTSQQHTNIIEEASTETQNKAENTSLPQSESPTTIPSGESEDSTLVTLPESDQSKKFAHDINFKIDQLEDHIESLTEQYAASEGKLRIAIGDIRSRTAIVTEEINKFGDQMLKADGENKDWLKELESHLRDAVDTLNGQLDGLDSQISTHHTSIQSIQADLNASYVKLDNRISALQQDTQTQFIEVFSEQEKQHQTQQAFAEYLEELQDKTSKTADDLYNTQVDSAKTQRENKKRFIIGVSSLAAAIALTAGAVTYLHLNQPDASAIEASVAASIGSLDANIADTYSTKAETTITRDTLSTQMVILNQQLSQTRDEASTAQVSTNQTLEELASKVSALQLSLYGPDDAASNAVTPSLEVFDKSWIASQDASNYSIQLVGVYRERAMFNFVNKHETSLSEHPLAFNVSEYRGQDWYNLVYGNFATFSEAQAVLDQLPDSLLKNAPWIRQLGSIQKTAVN